MGGKPMAGKRRIKLRFKLLILLACAVYALFVYFNQDAVLGELNKEKNELQEQYAKNNIEYAELQNELNYMNSDAYVEKTAREKLGWVKENELKFVEENK